MSTSPLKYFFNLQSFTCVFRNFLSVNKRYQFLMSIWTAMEIITAMYNIYFNELFRSAISQRNAYVTYLFFVTGFSIALMIQAIYYSRKFQHLINNFDNYCTLFGDKTYSENLQKKQRILTITVTLYCIFQVIVLLNFLYFDLKPFINVESLLKTILFNYNIFLCDLRFIYEHMIMHFILFIISEQLNTVTRSIEGESKNYYKKVAQEGGITTKVGEHVVKKFDFWMTAYKHVNCSIDLFNTIFNTELAVLLLIITVYLISYLYHMGLTIKDQSLSLFAINVCSITARLFAIYGVSQAGQRVQNSSIALRRKLCQLYIQAVGDEILFKKVKNLLRCFKTRPVTVCVIGSLPVNMTLLLSSIGFITSNTVIVLQFNNVL